MIYNGATPFLHGRYERSNIWVDGKGLGQLQIREYVVIDLKEGDYQFKVQRHDGLFTAKSLHDVNIDQTTKIIRIEPFFAGSSLAQVEELPKRFGKFVYAKNESLQ